MRRLLCVAAMSVAIGLTTAPTSGSASPPASPSAPSDRAIALLGTDNPSGKYKSDGTPLSKDPRRTKPQPSIMAARADTPQPECPPTVQCKFVPAVYHNNNPADPVDWGNYDEANRPHDSKINSVVIHDTEGDLQSVLDAFRDPLFYVSAHYVIDRDGTIYQMVRTKDIAWHAGNWWYNQHSIGIEHIGRAATGSTDYTVAMYVASAKLIKWLAQKYGIPMDRQHIIGHDNVPGTRATNIPDRVDPGPFWNWQKYMMLMGAPVLPTSGVNSPLVTVAPVWPLSKSPVTGCWPSDLPTCVPPGQYPTNFVYIRTASDPNAPLVTDPILGPGSTELGDRSARAFHGQQFIVADRKLGNGGMWYQVWFAGQLAWFHSPWSAPTAFPTKGTYATPKRGKASVQVFGRAIPEQSEYPDDFVPPAGSVPYPTPIVQYSIPAGQRYSVTDASPPTDHFFNWTFDHRLPYDQTNFAGKAEYIQIQYNGRVYFAKKADFDLVESK